MGSLRNPVGPLPSSIYWRRRAVALSLVALLTLLALWAVSTREGGGKEDRGGGSHGGSAPASSITPGPSSSGPAISDHPGGRDETGTGGSGDGGDSDGSDGDDGGQDDGEGDGGSAGSGSGGSGGSGGGSGVPAGTHLPDCASGAVELTLRSVKNSYAPDEKPKFELGAKNSSGHACEVDFTGAAVLSITFTGDDEEIWASDDCPQDDGRIVLRVPADGDASHTVTWDRRPSEPKCATPSAHSAQAGTYLVEARSAGVQTARVSFSLKKD